VIGWCDPVRFENLGEGAPVDRDLLSNLICAADDIDKGTAKKKSKDTAKKKSTAKGRGGKPRRVKQDPSAGGGAAAADGGAAAADEGAAADDAAAMAAAAARAEAISVDCTRKVRIYPDLNGRQMLRIWVLIFRTAMNIFVDYQNSPEWHAGPLYRRRPASACRVRGEDQGQ
jgi:hypothetical protein